MITIFKKLFFYKDSFDAKSWILTPDRLRMKIFLIGISSTLVAHEPIMKPRNIKKEKTSEVKQNIGNEFEKVLTSSTTLIASLSETIDTVVKKLKQLVSNDDVFFAKQKTTQLQCYKHRLEVLRKNLEKTVECVNKELESLKKNYEI